ncbi:MAG: hypothetical protein ACM3PE_06105 [Deltaproteobacteria bacterium]
MRKKLLALLLCIIFTFTVVGCKSTTKTNMDFSNKKTNKSTVTKDDESMEMRYHRVNK